LVYAKTVELLGMKHKATTADLSSILTEDIEKEVKEAA